MTRVLVEKHFDPPLTAEQWERDLQIGLPCHRAHDVRWVRSMLSRDRAKIICEFEAPDAETVRTSFRKSGLPYVRIWAIDFITPAEPSLLKCAASDSSTSCCFRNS